MWQQWSGQHKKVRDLFTGVDVPTFNAEEIRNYLGKIPEEFRGLDMGLDANANVAAESFKEFCRFLPLLKHSGGYTLHIAENEVVVILFSQDHKMRFTFSKSGGLSYTMFTKYGGHSLYRKRLEGELDIIDDADLYIIEKVLKFMLP
jgi:hypothetical protein